jgi:hypothetical protein
MKNLLRFGMLFGLLLFIGASLFPQHAQAFVHVVAPGHGPALLAALGVGTSGMTLGCVMTPIEAIVADDCPNPGGLTDLHVIRRRDILTFPEVDEDGVTIATALIPKPSTGFVPWDFAQDSGEVNHKSSGDAGTQSIAHELNVYVPRGSAATDSVVQAALNGDFVVIGRDSNGNLRICGDKRRGVKFEHDYKSGKKGTDKNGTDFKFSGEGFTHVPYYYTAAIPLKA